ncbi:MAG: hypothetical protein JKY56_17055 [Kofleriaceae bacterium]|nr:hypothetical protein [Kofleriaceae bacterium]
MSDIEKLCQQVISARSKRDELKESLASASQELDSLESELAGKLLQRNEAKLEYDGVQFSATNQRSWKTRPEGKETLLGLLKESVPELVKESVHASTLSSYPKKNEERLESAMDPWWVAAKECLLRSESTSLSVRKKKPKK